MVIYNLVIVVGFVNGVALKEGSDVLGLIGIMVTLFVIFIGGIYNVCKPSDSCSIYFSL